MRSGASDGACGQSPQGWWRDNTPGVEGPRRIRRLDDILLCDEPLGTLLGALQRLVEFDGSLPCAEAAALLRAIMRIEAELLREDADALADWAQEQRTQEARRLDALLELAQRIGATAPFVRTRTGGHRRQ